MRLRPWLVLASALALPTPAGAQVVRTVRLERAAPFDAWCLEPVCTPAAGTPAARPALLKPPAALAPSAGDGLLEQELKRRLATTLNEQARALDVWSKPLADLTSSATAAMTGDQAGLAKASGLTGSVLRVALVLRVREAIPEQAACSGQERLDALYEGLALSVTLAPLEFPAATRTVTEPCVATAQASAALVDSTVLARLVSADLVQRLQSALQQLKAAQAACRNLGEKAPAEAAERFKAFEAALSFSSPPPVAELLARLEQLSALRPAELEQAAPECAAALPSSLPRDAEPLNRLGELGLGAAPAELVAQAAASRATAAQRAVELERLLRALVERGRLARAELESVLQQLSRELAPAGAAQDVFSHLLAALPAGVSEDASTGALLDPAQVARALKDQYGLDEQGVPTLRSLLGFRPTPWIADANVGIPSLRDDAFRVVANGRLGYHGRALGIVGHGGIKEFDIEQAGVITQDAHYFGGLDGFLLLGSSRSKVRFEARAASLVDYVDTTVIGLPSSAAGLDFRDYDSLLIRAGLRLGLRVAPSEQLLLRLSAGGGYQFETHDSTTFFQNESFESVDTSSGQAGGSLLLSYRIVPSVLGARAQLAGDYYKLTIDRLTFDFAGAPQLERPQASQLELAARLFVDLDVIAFGGFVPSAFGAIDYLSRTGAGPAVTSTVPSAGIGVMRRSD